MANLRLEGVTIHIRCLSNHLVAYMGVSDNGIACLDGLENGGRRGDGVNCRWLRN